MAGNYVRRVGRRFGKPVIVSEDRDSSSRNPRAGSRRRNVVGSRPGGRKEGRMPKEGPSCRRLRGKVFSSTSHPRKQRKPEITLLLPSRARVYAANETELVSAFGRLHRSRLFPHPQPPTPSPLPPVAARKCVQLAAQFFTISPSRGGGKPGKERTTLLHP